jgi:catechol 2,3-dioxygenase-like lactoylglutathione lyase family enzyme
MTRVIRRIDHLSIVVDDAPATFGMLRERLGLVAVQPVFDVPDEMQSAAGERTGFFTLGNIALEVVEASVIPREQRDEIEVNIIVFEPEPIDAAVAELDRRGITYLSPRPIVIPEGVEFPVTALPDTQSKPEPGSIHGTQLMFQGFLGGNALAMCYEWTYVPVSVMRDWMRRALEETPDRPLPIQRATEVVIGATDVDAERRRWQQLLDPVVEHEPGLWRFDDGPALRLIAHERNAVVGLVLHVSDLDGAECYLKEHDMLASTSANELVIAPGSIGGLNLTLVG